MQAAELAGYHAKRVWELVGGRRRLRAKGDPRRLKGVELLAGGSSALSGGRQIGEMRGFRVTVTGAG